MLQMAQDVLKAIQERVRTSLRVMAELAESVGVPSTVTGLLAGKERPGCCQAEEVWTDSRSRPRPEADADHEHTEFGAGGEGAAAVEDTSDRRGAFRRRGSESVEGIRPLKVDDAISGSTYLARIVWSLGVAELEGSGPLRPADMARMIMSRSPVSLEPPNVARYIRRSKPTCIEVARTEGSSNYYALNAEGRALFEELFRNSRRTEPKGAPSDPDPR